MKTPLTEDLLRRYHQVRVAQSLRREIFQAELKSVTLTDKQIQHELEMLFDRALMSRGLWDAPGAWLPFTKGSHTIGLLDITIYEERDSGVSIPTLVIKAPKSFEELTFYALGAYGSLDFNVLCRPRPGLA